MEKKKRSVLQRTYSSTCWTYYTFSAKGASVSLLRLKKKKKKKKEKKTSQFHCPYFRKVLENVLHDSKIVHVDIIPVFITKSYGVSRNHSNFDLTKFCI